jgi:protein phosphatase
MALIELGSASDVGLVRHENQDAFGAFPANILEDELFPGLLFVVADGMGGHRGGREASRIALQTISTSFYAATEGTVPERLKSGFIEANTAVRDYGKVHHEYRGLGTTLTVLSLCKGEVRLAHVGDTRAYRISGDTITQLTDDHSIVQEWLRKGWITSEQAQSHPERSLLYRALGVGAEVSVDVVEHVEYHKGDSLLLCSDGLTTHVEDEEIREIVSVNSPQEACDTLVARALERGGFDNVTVQIIRRGTRP